MARYSKNKNKNIPNNAYQGGESKGNFFMEQAKMTPRKELCESKVSVMSFLPCY